jgi:hypothetical protein
MNSAMVWYVGYGSNVSTPRLGQYLDVPGEPSAAADITTRWLDLNRHLYFAGDSRRWGGPVAFLALTPGGAHTVAKAYRLTRTQFTTVVRAENGNPDLTVDTARLGLTVNEWAELPVEQDRYRGKYNAILRLPDIDNEPCFTVTTSRSFDVRPPTDEYAQTIVAGLSDRLGAEAAQAYVAGYASHSDGGSNATHLGVSPTARTWSGSTALAPSPGFASLRLPTPAGDPHSEGTRQIATVRREGSTGVHAWVTYSSDPEHTATVSDDLAPALGLPDHLDEHPLVIDSYPARWLRQLPGDIHDLPDTDVVQVHPDIATAFGPWALAVAPLVSGPVRLVSRESVPIGSMRLAYGARTLLGVTKEERVMLQPIDRRGAGAGSGAGSCAAAGSCGGCRSGPSSSCSAHRPSRCGRPRGWWVTRAAASCGWTPPRWTTSASSPATTPGSPGPTAASSCGCCCTPPKPAST